MFVGDGHADVDRLKDYQYASYLPTNGFTWMNQLSTVGAAILGVSMLPFLINVDITARHGVRVTVEDRWGTAGSLEWATSCPRPRDNFNSIPRIRSESPAFDRHHPEVGIPVGVSRSSEHARSTPERKATIDVGLSPAVVVGCLRDARSRVHRGPDNTVTTNQQCRTDPERHWDG